MHIHNGTLHIILLGKNTTSKHSNQQHSWQGMSFAVPLFTFFNNNLSPHQELETLHQLSIQPVFIQLYISLLHNLHNILKMKFAFMTPVNNNSIITFLIIIQLFITSYSMKKVYLCHIQFLNGELIFFDDIFENNQMNRLEEALLEDVQAIKKDPENSVYYNSKGITQMNRLEDALIYYDVAIQKNPVNSYTISDFYEYQKERKWLMEHNHYFHKFCHSTILAQYQERSRLCSLLQHDRLIRLFIILSQNPINEQTYHHYQMLIQHHQMKNRLTTLHYFDRIIWLLLSCFTSHKRIDLSQLLDANVVPQGEQQTD
ncbi:unnamed protein product [Paramecium octaurelia]|uniref:Uncharacterized protein n=1 Tax=Paramecium octaurelia TaxID=43137 RepID=A0A8S1TTC0_PAROT|nr:unnamed protein product [Paramecium octaurelia]